MASAYSSPSVYSLSSYLASRRESPPVDHHTPSTAATRTHSTVHTPSPLYLGTPRIDDDFFSFPYPTHLDRLLDVIKSSSPTHRERLLNVLKEGTQRRRETSASPPEHFRPDNRPHAAHATAPKHCAEGSDRVDEEWRERDYWSHGSLEEWAHTTASAGTSSTGSDSLCSRCLSEALRTVPHSPCHTGQENNVPTWYKRKLDVIRRRRRTLLLQELLVRCELNTIRTQGNAYQSNEGLWGI